MGSQTPSLCGGLDTAWAKLAGGGKIAALFDGSEKIVSWDVFPWYVRSVIAP